MAGGLDRLIATLSVVATILVGWITLNATVDIASWGDTPPKNLEASYIGPSDPLSDLSKNQTLIEVDVKSGGKKLENVRVVYATLKNTGAAPILPSDMTEPLSLKAVEPWKIIGVGERNYLGNAAPKLKWHKVSDTEFLSQATLINPGDYIWLPVYLTWQGDKEPTSKEGNVINWNARIANLKSITVDNTFENMEKNSNFGIQVRIWGWGLVFVVASFAIYNFLTITLLIKAGVVVLTRWISFIYIPIASCINLSAAEAGTSFVFGADPYGIWAVSPLFNTPPLIVNVILIGWLFWYNRTKSSSAGNPMP